MGAEGLVGVGFGEEGLVEEVEAVGEGLAVVGFGERGAEGEDHAGVAVEGLFSFWEGGFACGAVDVFEDADEDVGVGDGVLSDLVEGDVAEAVEVGSVDDDSDGAM